MTGFADLLAADPQRARVIARPTPASAAPAARGAELASRGLAALYVALLDQLDLSDVTVIGNSIGGWITAEMALLESPRVSGIVLSTRSASRCPATRSPTSSPSPWTRSSQLSYHDPEPFRIDPATLPPGRAGDAAGNRAALASTRAPAMSDPTLRRTSRRARAPHPGVVGRERPDRRPRLRSRLRRRDPPARFQLLPDTGHVPQLETPDQVLHAIWDRADTFSGQRAPGVS